MSTGYHIVVLGSLVPDLLQTLEPVQGPTGPGLKNELMLPAVLDPWAAHALFEAAHVAAKIPGSKIWLVSLGPKAKLQQLMMSIASKLPFELVAIDASASGFTDPVDVAAALADAIEKIPGLDRTQLLLFGGCASASRDAGVTVQLVGERLGIMDQFLAADELTMSAEGTLTILERVEGGRYLVSEVTSPPCAIAWATGNLPEPPNNPHVGMLNMRTMMPALQKAQPVQFSPHGTTFHGVELPRQERHTRIVKDVSIDEMAREIADWIKG